MKTDRISAFLESIDSQGLSSSQEGLVFHSNELLMGEENEVAESCKENSYACVNKGVCENSSNLLACENVKEPPKKNNAVTANGCVVVVVPPNTGNCLTCDPIFNGIC